MNELAISLVGERVKAAPPDLPGLQHFLLAESKHRGAYQALIDAERLDQADQAAEPDDAAVRADRIAEDGKDQGTRIELLRLLWWIRLALRRLRRNSFLFVFVMLSVNRGQFYGLFFHLEQRHRIGYVQSRPICPRPRVSARCFFERFETANRQALVVARAGFLPLDFLVA